MTMHRSFITPITLTVALACTSGPAAEDEAGTTTSPSTTDADDEASTGTESSSDDDDATVGTSTTSPGDDLDEDDEGVFLPGDDVPLAECDIFAQDCPQGEKCVPYSSNGDQAWDALKCVPVMGEQAPGESCVYDGVEASTDDCDDTSWCFNVDENGNGICHAFCTGTPDTPECPPMSECAISGSGVISICIPNCDPVVQDCPEDTGCYWGSNNFICIVTTLNIPTGEPCGYVNDCAAGNMCVDASLMPDCDGSACCGSFCDLGLGDAQCDLLPDTVCVPFFEQGMAPAEYEHVGVCILPP
jgi:hypothetical protein